MSRPDMAVLLFEPQFVLRRTLASVARQLGLAEVHEAATFQAASQAIDQRAFDLVIVAVDGAPLPDLVRLTGRCGAARVLGLLPPGEPLSVPGLHVLMHKPLKVKALLQLLAG